MAYRVHFTTSLPATDRISRAAKSSPLLDVATAISRSVSDFSLRDLQSSLRKEMA